MSRVERPRYSTKHQHNAPTVPTRKMSLSARELFELPPNARRHFLQQLAVAGTGLVFPFTALRAANKGNDKTPATSANDPWATIAAVQNHLFPAADDTPGADAIQATAYLQRVVNAPRFTREEKNFILNGPDWLNQLAVKKYRVTFVSLKAPQREQLLRQVSQSSAGENWLSTLLLYIFEAMLSASVYGGNPRGIGWQWLQHDPGFPQPDPSQHWMELIKK